MNRFTSKRVGLILFNSSRSFGDLNSQGIHVSLPAFLTLKTPNNVWPDGDGESCNTKTEGLPKDVEAYIRKESVGQEVSIERDGYSQLVAANHALILLLRG
jgi:hypothetical protein